MLRDALRSLGIINPIKTDIYGLTKTSTEVLRREIGRNGTVRISTVTHCFNWIYNPYSRLYTVIYTDKLIFLEMDDRIITLGMGIDVEIDEEWLASFGP